MNIEVIPIAPADSRVPGMILKQTCYHEQVRQFERKLIRRALHGTHGNMSQAANILGIHRNTIIARCNSLGIDPSAFIQSALSIARRRWKDKLRGKGLCLDCGSQPSGGEGGTPSRCPVCAEAARERSRKRHRLKIAARPPKPEPVIVPRPIEQVFKPKQVQRVDRMLMLASVQKVSNLSL